METTKRTKGHLTTFFHTVSRLTMYHTKTSSAPFDLVCLTWKIFMDDRDRALKMILHQGLREKVIEN